MAKKAAKDTQSTIDANVTATVANGTNGTAGTAGTAGTSTVDAAAGASTAAATRDIHGDTTAKSDSNASGAAQAATPPVDPSAVQPNPVTPQPIAVVVSAPVILVAPTTVGNESSGGSGTGQDAAPIAASGDVAGAPSGNPDPAAADGAKSAATAGTAQADGGAKVGAKTAASIPLTPQPPQKGKISPAGPNQLNAADGTQSPNTSGPTAIQAAANHARQAATTNQSTGGTAGPRDNSNGNLNIDPNAGPNVDPKQDPAASTTPIEDIVRQALDTASGRVEAPAADTASGGTSHSESVQAGNAQQSPDGSASLIAPANLTTSAAPTDAPTATATPSAVPIAGLAIEIASHARAGKNRFEIRLDPPELGRIDVRLDVDHEGTVTSHLVVDRQETLDMLRRDAPELQRSLQDAGLKTADNALQFSLRDQGSFGGQNPNPNFGSPAGAPRVVIPDQELPAVETTVAAYNRVIGARAGIDIRV